MARSEIYDVARGWNHSYHRLSSLIAALSWIKISLRSFSRRLHSFGWDLDTWCNQRHLMPIEEGIMAVTIPDIKSFFPLTGFELFVIWVSFLESSSSSWAFLFFKLLFSQVSFLLLPFFHLPFKNMMIITDLDLYHFVSVHSWDLSNWREHL